MPDGGRDKNSRHVYGGGTAEKLCADRAERQTGEKDYHREKGHSVLQSADILCRTDSTGCGVRNRHPHGECEGRASYLHCGGQEFCHCRYHGQLCQRGCVPCGADEYALSKKRQQAGVFRQYGRSVELEGGQRGNRAFPFLCGCCKRNQPPEGCGSGL